MILTDFIFVFIIRVVFFFNDPSWSESNIMLFLFFYSIWVGASRSELIRPELAVRVDPVRLLRRRDEVSRKNLRQVNSPNNWEKFQICSTDMYLIRFLPNVVVFCMFFVNFEFLWRDDISRSLNLKKLFQVEDCVSSIIILELTRSWTQHWKIILRSC